MSRRHRERRGVTFTAVSLGFSSASVFTFTWPHVWVRKRVKVVAMKTSEDCWAHNCDATIVSTQLWREKQHASFGDRDFGRISMTTSMPILLTWTGYWSPSAVCGRSGMVWCCEQLPTVIMPLRCAAGGRNPKYTSCSSESASNTQTTSNMAAEGLHVSCSIFVTVISEDVWGRDRQHRGRRGASCRLPA